jgi:hypothetical protein
MKKSKMKALTIRYCVYFILSSSMSCTYNGHTGSLNSIITSDCYWDVHDTFSVANGKVGYCYQFKKNGKSNYFFYDRKGVRTNYDFGDLVVPKNWRIIGDTLMYLQGIERIVVEYSSDTILLKNPANKQIDTLIRNCKR